jgi:hypothetical protein
MNYHTRSMLKLLAVLAFFFPILSCATVTTVTPDMLRPEEVDNPARILPLEFSFEQQSLSLDDARFVPIQSDMATVFSRELRENLFEPPRFQRTGWSVSPAGSAVLICS